MLGKDIEMLRSVIDSCRRLMSMFKYPMSRSLFFIYAVVTMSQMGPLQVGQVIAHLQHDLNPTQISSRVLKDDGISTWTPRRMQEVVAKLTEDPEWNGERKEGSGAPRKTTPKQDLALVRELIKQRGKKKVTISYLRRNFDWAKNLSDYALRDRLHEAGLKFMRRRRKSIVSKLYLKPRIRYCTRVLTTSAQELRRVAYTDGTTFFLDRNEEDLEHNQRAALGILRSGNIYIYLSF